PIQAARHRRPRHTTRHFANPSIALLTSAGRAFNARGMLWSRPHEAHLSKTARVWATMPPDAPGTYHLSNDTFLVTAVSPRDKSPPRPSTYRGEPRGSFAPPRSNPAEIDSRTVSCISTTLLGALPGS